MKIADDVVFALVSSLRGVGFPVAAAFQVKKGLVIVSPLVDREGLLVAYSVIQNFTRPLMTLDGIYAVGVEGDPVYPRLLEHAKATYGPTLPLPYQTSVRWNGWIPGISYLTERQQGGDEIKTRVYWLEEYPTGGE